MWKVILATLVIFGTGVITGGLLVNYTNHTSPAAHPSPTVAVQPGTPGGQNPGRQNRLPAPMPGPLRKDFLDRMDQELQLSASQKERIENIISEGQERTRLAWQEIEPQMRREMMQTRGKIRAILTPEQQGRFEEMMRRPRELRRPLPGRESPASLPAN